MGSIDIVANLFTAQEITNNQVGIDQDFMAQIRMPPAMRKGVSIPQYIAKMDSAGIDRSLIVAVRAGDMRMKGSFEIPNERVFEV